MPNFSKKRYSSRSSSKKRSSRRRTKSRSKRRVRSCQNKLTVLTVQSKCPVCPVCPVVTSASRDLDQKSILEAILVIGKEYNIGKISDLEIQNEFKRISTIPDIQDKLINAAKDIIQSTDTTVNKLKTMANKIQTILPNISLGLSLMLASSYLYMETTNKKNDSTDMVGGADQPNKYLGLIIQRTVEAVNAYNTVENDLKTTSNPQSLLQKALNSVKNNTGLSGKTLAILGGIGLAALYLTKTPQKIYKFTKEWIETNEAKIMEAETAAKAEQSEIKDTINNSPDNIKKMFSEIENLFKEFQDEYKKIKQSVDSLSTMSIIGNTTHKIMTIINAKERVGKMVDKTTEIVKTTDSQAKVTVSTKTTENILSKFTLSGMLSKIMQRWLDLKELVENTSLDQKDNNLLLKQINLFRTQINESSVDLNNFNLIIEAKEAAAHNTLSAISGLVQVLT
jgi:hypothetical protein